MPTGAEVLSFKRQILGELSGHPVRLRDVRQKVRAFEEFAGDTWIRRTTFGLVVSLLNDYITLPERLELQEQENEIYWEHVRRGDFDDSNYHHVRTSAVYELCVWWLTRNCRYPYGDVRVLRPIIGEYLIEAAEWARNPYPDQAAKLGQWYEELAPDGPLYPTDEHLAYVERFEAAAEDIVWDCRGQDYLTIVNFPAPPRTWPPDQWWCTQHVLR